MYENHIDMKCNNCAILYDIHLCTIPSFRTFDVQFMSYDMGKCLIQNF